MASQWNRIAALFRTKHTAEKGLMTGKIDLPRNAKLILEGQTSIAVMKRKDTVENGPVYDVYLVSGDQDQSSSENGGWHDDIPF